MSRESGFGIGDSQKPELATMPACPDRSAAALGMRCGNAAPYTPPLRIPNPQSRIPALNP